MRVVLQRVKKTSVKVQEKTVGEIPYGFLVLLGVAQEDSSEDVLWLVDKILKLRLFGGGDNGSFLEKNIKEVGGSILVVSQFTLFGDCRKGTRPSFGEAAEPDKAKELYNLFVEKLKEKGVQVETGIFGAEMEVELVNNGPVTLVIDSKNAKIR